MTRGLKRRALRGLGYGAGIGAVAVGVVFGWFVLISWGVLRAALGTAQLVLILMVVAAAAGTWIWVGLRRFRRPGSPLARSARLGVAAVSLLALVCGVVVVPATRARLETNKCRRIAAHDATSQARCRLRLEGRRQWWTLGLSHENG